MVLKSNILKFIRPSPNSVYNCRNPRGICLITRLRLGLSHLREQKFKHDFQDTLNPLCSCGNDVESTEHFLLHCPQFVNERRILLSNLGNFNCSLFENTSKVLTQTLLFGNMLSDNSKILSATIQAWKFGGNDRFVPASFPSLIKDGNDNSFLQIHLHNTNAFFENLTDKHFYNLAYNLHFLHTDLRRLQN